MPRSSHDPTGSPSGSPPSGGGSGPTGPALAHGGLSVGGPTVGAAARRDGALELLRALDGIEIVALDVRGTGPARYRRADVIARFEGPRFPLDVPCPERGP